MTVHEAIEIFKESERFIHREENVIAIECMEKQIPKKPNLEQKDGNGNVVERCPNCLSFGILDYCMRCGQKIDWSEEDD